MKKHNSSWMALAALLAGLGMTSNAHAVWTFANTTVTSTTKFNDVTTNSTGAPTTTLTGSGITVKLSAISAVNSTFAGNGTWSAASLVNHGDLGQGVCSSYDSSSTSNTCPSSTGDHAVDNKQNTEAILLNFTLNNANTNVALTSIGMGWTGSNAADVSLFRWIGTGTPNDTSSNLVGKDANSMTGWQLVGNYGNVQSDNTNPYSAVNSSGLTSSWWMVSAYNAGYTATQGVTENVGSLDTSNDYFKLFAVAASVPSTPTPGTVPEPGSLALASLALFGVIYTRRKAQAKR